MQALLVEVSPCYISECFMQALLVAEYSLVVTLSASCKPASGYVSPCCISECSMQALLVAVCPLVVSLGAPYNLC